MDLGPFFPPGTPTLTWEVDNPLAYFNLAGLVFSILLLRALSDRRGTSSLVDGAWAASLVLAIGTGLHFIGDIIGVAESWDHQFIHLVVLVALIVLFLAARRGD
jgi:hypothetical protein